MLKKLKFQLYNLLRWSEKFTKTDMVYLTKGGLWFSFGQIISTVVTFGMAVAFAHYLPSDVYGTYKFLLSVIGIFAITTLSGMGGILSQAVARGYEGSLFPAIKAKITWGFVGSLGSIGAAIYYGINGNTQLMIAFFIAAFFIPFMDSFHIYQDYLQGKKRFDLSVPYFSASQVVATLLMIITVVFTTNLYIILLVYLTSWTGTRIFFFKRSIQKLPPNNQIDPQTIPYGKNSSFIDMIASLIGSLDQILIFHYLGPVSLAVYSFTIAPISQLVSPFRNIPILAMPKLATRPVPEIHLMLKKRFGIAALIAAAIFIIYFFFAPLFFQIFFPKYIDAVPLSRIFALTILFSIPNTILSAALAAKITFLPKKILYLWNIPGILSTIFILSTITHLGIHSVLYARILLVATTVTIGYILWKYIVRKDKKLTDSTPDTTPESFLHNV